MRTVRTRFLSLAILLLFVSCTMPYADKQFIGFSPNVTGAERVRISKDGPITVFSIQTGPAPEIIPLLADLKDRNGCRDIKNADIEYFHNYYYIVGFPRIVIKADCIK